MACGTPHHPAPNPPFLRTNNVEQCAPKILRDDASVQLIVFFAAISETLKKEIYRGDKPRVLLIENKGAITGVDEVAKRISNRAHSLCESADRGSETLR
jgi:hypothetical protein